MKAENFVKAMHRKKKLESYSLHNWARTRHAFETKTNLGVPNTHTNYQYVSENRIRSPWHPDLCRNPLPIGWTLPLHRPDAPVFVSTKGSTTPGSQPPGVTQHALQLSLSRLGTPNNFSYINKINTKEDGKLRILDEFIQLIYRMHNR